MVGKIHKNNSNDKYLNIGKMSNFKEILTSKLNFKDKIGNFHKQTKL